MEQNEKLNSITRLVIILPLNIGKINTIVKIKIFLLNLNLLQKKSL